MKLFSGTSNCDYPKEKVLNSKKIKILDVSWLCAQAIKRQETGESLSELYTNINILDENQIKLDFIE